MNEIWKDIFGYEGIYLVSNYGKVKSIKRYVKHQKGGLKIIKEIILKNGKSHGYDRVTLFKKGLRRYYLIHRLVAKAFIFNKYNKKTVNHIDGNKTNNTVSNLEWNTCSENCQHAYNTGLSQTWNKGITGYITKRSNTVVQKDMSNNVLYEYSNISNARRKTGINHISACCRKKRNSAGGYKWEFKNDTNKRDRIGLS